MADKDNEKRIAELEKGLAAAQRDSEEFRREAKLATAALRDHQAATRRSMGSINSMQDLADLRRNGTSPYGTGDEETAHERRLALMKKTARTKDGRRHYYIDAPAVVEGVYLERDQVISVPENHIPSMTWEPVQATGKDKTGKLVFVPLSVLEQAPEGTDEADDEAQQLDAGKALTNTQINQQRTAAAAKTARLGPGSGETPAPTRPSDTTVG